MLYDDDNDQFVPSEEDYATAFGATHDTDPDDLNSVECDLYEDDDDQFDEGSKPDQTPVLNTPTEPTKTESQTPTLVDITQPDLDQVDRFVNRFRPVWAKVADAGVSARIVITQGYYDTRTDRPRFNRVSTLETDATKDQWEAAITKALTGANGEPANVYVGTQPFETDKLAVLRPAQRGSNTDVAAITCLVADLDGDWGLHAANNEPTRDQIMTLLDDCVLGRPSMLIATAGGYHAWWLLDRPLPNNEDTSKLLRRWGNWLKTYAATHGDFQIDVACSVGPTRVLRVPGTYNNKTDKETGQPWNRPVTIEYDDGPLLCADDLEDLLPDLKAIRAERAAAAKRKPASKPLAQALNTQEAFETLLEACGCEQIGKTDGWVRPGGDTKASSGTLYADEHKDTGETTYRLGIFGTHWISEWGLDQYTANDTAQLRIVELVANRWCADDRSLAHRILDAHNNVDALLNELNNSTPEVLRATHPEPGNLPVPISTGKVLDAGDELGLVTIKGKNGNSPIPIRNIDPEAAWCGDELVAIPVDPFRPRASVIDGPVLMAIMGNKTVEGVYEESVKVEQGDDGGAKTSVTYRQQLSFVPVRTSKVHIMTANENGQVEPAGSPSYAVRIYRRAHYTDSLEMLDAETSRHPDKLLAAMSCGVVPPGTREQRAAMVACLDALGFDHQRGEQAFCCYGWVVAKDADGRARHLFLGREGSVDSSGARADIHVTEPPGSDRGALSGKPYARVGWPEIAKGEDLRDTFGCIQPYLDITPTKPAAWGLLGLLFAAPLGQSDRGVPWLVAAPESGKSLLLATMNGFLHADGSASKSTLTIDAGNASKAGTVRGLEIMRFLPTQFDDYRHPGGSKSLAAQRITEAMTTAVQHGYGAASESKSTATRGLGGSAKTVASVAVSGERIPDSDNDAVATRCCPFRLRRGDIEIKRVDDADGKGKAQIDTWRDQWAFTRKANRLYGAYLQWLAGLMDLGKEHGGIDGSVDGLRKHADQVRGDIVKQHASGRVTENMASLLVGWKMFRAFARTYGMEDAIPSEQTINDLFEQALNDAQDERAESDPCATWVARFMQAVQSGNRGYLQVPESQHAMNGKPANRDLLSAVGYQKLAGSPDWTPLKTAPRLGELIWTAWESKTGTSRWLVAITTEEAKRFWEPSAPEKVQPAQMWDAIGGLSVKEGQAGQSRSVALGNGKTKGPRGIVIEADIFGFDLPDPT